MTKHTIISLFVFSLLAGRCASTPENPNPDTAVAPVQSNEIIPSRYKTLYIHNIRSRAETPYIPQRLKEKLRIAYLADGRLQTDNKKEESDIWLYTTIEHYRKTPLHYDQFGKATQYRIAVVATIRLIKNPNILESKEEEPVLLPTTTIQSFATFSPLQFETEMEAMESLMDSLGQRIVLTSFEGWYTDLKTEEELNYKVHKNQKSILKNFQERSDVVIPKDMPKEERDRLEREYDQYQYKDDE